MTDRAIDWAEIALPREEPFSLAGTQVRPAALEVEHGGRSATLEPRVMKVLTALHRSLGQPVSRDELIAACWGGRIVTEGAINRCIAQLRKALAPNPRIRVDTIATVGYRLQASAEVHRVGGATTTGAAPEASDAVSWTRRPLVWALAGLAVLAAAGGGLWMQLAGRPVVWTASAFRPLTSDPGVETYPALSPNGQQLVYAARSRSDERRDLFLRGIEDGAPVRLTSSPGDESSVAWSPRGDRIAFVRYPGYGACTIVVMPVPGGAERTAAACQATTGTRVSWLDDRTLVISDRPTTADARRLRTIDIATGATRDMTTPPADSLGDSEPQVSPDGKRLVFRRSLAHGADDLFVLDLATRRERALTDDGWKAAGFSWSADSRHVFFSSNRGGAFGLWTVDTRAGGPPRQVSTGLGGVTFSRMSSDAQNRLAVEIPHGRVTLSRLAPSGGSSDIASSADLLWDPAVGPDGAVAYIAGSSGAPEVWVAEPDGRVSRLTSLVASLVSRPAWSADGQTIAFLGVKGRQPQIYTVRRDGSQLRAVTSDTTDKYDPAMMADGRIAYIERGPSGWRAMSVAPGAAPQPLPGGDGWRALRAGPDGTLYGTRNGGNTVLALGAPRAVADVTGADNWAVGPAGVYFVRQRPERRGWAIWLQPWSGSVREAADFPDAAHSLAVDPEGALYITQVRDDQIDLGLLSLTQGR